MDKPSPGPEDARAPQADKLQTRTFAPAGTPDNAQAETLSPSHIPRSDEEAATLGSQESEHFEPPRAACPLVPGYEVLEELGRGGMGVVYKARQTGLNRIVALKMILSGGYAADQDVARFRAEAEAVARLQHPNIVQIHEIGQADGTPFFSLEYAAGGSLANSLRGNPQPARRAAEVAETLARAVQAAHERGIIHRDLKPANVLLSPRSNVQGLKPKDLGPGILDLVLFDLKISDFGLAKKIDEAGVTASGAIMGTPSYMAPEQAGQNQEISPRTDVYALGAILYELVTGRPPFRAETPLDTVLQVISDEPVPPSRLVPRLPHDLDTICQKCLQKEPLKRYATARELAEDLHRFVAGEPIRARPIGPAGRLWRWCWRNQLVASLTATAAALLVVVAVVSTVAYWQTRHALNEADEEKQLAVAAQAKEAAARMRATHEREAARRNLYLARMHLAQHAWESGDTRRLQEILDLQVPAPGEPDYRGWEWHFLRSQVRSLLRLDGRTARVAALAWSPDGTRLAAAGGNGNKAGELRVWDSRTGRALMALHREVPYHVSAVAWSPDGKRLASGGGKLGGFRNSLPGEVKIWDAQTGKKLLDLVGQMGRVECVAWSPDGKRLASAGGEFGPPGQAKVWDATNGRPLFDLPGHRRQVNSVAWRPDGQQLATASTDGTIKIWEAASGKGVRTLQAHRRAAYAGVWSPDGRRLASVGADGTAKVWDAATGHDVLTVPGGTDLKVSWTPDGGHVALNYPNGTITIWQLTPKTSETIDTHVPTLAATAWSPDYRRLALATSDQTVQIWDRTPVPEALVLGGGKHPVFGVAWSPDSKRLATSGAEATVWDARSGRKVASFAGPKAGGGALFSLSWSPDGQRLVWGGTPRLAGILAICDMGTGKEHTWTGHFVPPLSVAWSPDGSLIASGSADHSIKLWDAVSGKEKAQLNGHTDYVYSVAWRTDGGSLVSASKDGTLRLWDVASKRGAILRNAAGPLRTAAWSPDCRRIASGGPDLAICDAGSGKEVLDLRGHSAPIHAISWSHHAGIDQQRLASVSDDGTLKVWEVVTGQELLALRAGKLPFLSVGWSPDGRSLAAGTSDGTIKVWSIRENGK